MIPITPIGAKEELYPMIQNPWEFFSEKGLKTVFVSVGTGSSCLPELDIAETLGCPILKLDVPEDSAKWSEIKEILKSRKISDSTSEFAKVASRKWVLPKNLLVESCVPGFAQGSFHDGTAVRPWIQVLQEHCSYLALPEGELRLDLLKVDKTPHQSMILHSLFDAGIRPSLILVNWNEAPDSDLRTTTTAGHLQMLGYALVGKEGTRFLYYYMDVNYYETCSWEGIAKHLENPMMSNLVRSLIPGSSNSGIVFPLEK
jgi:hypothetical protein